MSDTYEPQPAPTVPAGADFAIFDTVSACNHGAEIELKHPTSFMPTGAFISIVGKDSDRVLKAMHAKRNAAKMRVVMARKMGKDLEPETSEQEELDEIELLTNCITGWRGLNVGGAPLDYNEANVRMILAKSPEIRRQVDRAITDLANFISG